MKKVGSYVLSDKIGEGQFGVVYLATNIDTDAVYAAKSISLRKIEKLGLEQACLLEINTMLASKSPDVVALRDVLRTENNLYLFMECCPGGNLRAQLDRGRVEERLAKRWLLNIVDACIVMHEAGVIHRDLKLQNVLLTDPNPEFAAAKVSDFGIARWGGDEPLDMTCSGSRLYMAPELPGHTPASCMVDVWSFGVLADLLLGCGVFSLNFTEADLSEAQRHVAERIEAARISIECRELLSTTLQLNPSDRRSFREIRRLPFFAGVGTRPGEDGLNFE